LNTQKLYQQIVSRFLQLPGIMPLLGKNVAIRAHALSPQEAIGNTERKDYPILTGKDVMLEATCNDFRGQAFTDAPSDFSGPLSEILALPFETDAHARGLLIATINAVMGSLGLCDRTVHCKDGGPKRCGVEAAAYVKECYGDRRVLLVGLQPSILQNLADSFTKVRVLDLNPDNIGLNKCGVVIGDGEKDRREAMEWAELILCTGSAVCNGTLVNYLDTGVETLFYGTTLSGTAKLLGLKRLCFADQYQEICAG
jgi:hypothetical protein